MRDGRPVLTLGGLLVVAWSRASASGVTEMGVDADAPAITISAASGSNGILLPIDADSATIGDAIVDVLTAKQEPLSAA